MKLYLHLRKDEHLVEDLDGSEYKSLASAVDEAVSIARELMAIRLRRGLDLHCDAAFEVADEQGRVLRRLPFEEAIPKRRTTAREPQSPHPWP